MTFLPQLASQDWQQSLNDWGRPVTLQEVRQDYDPTSGQLRESTFSTTLQAIRQSEQVRTTSSTATMNLTRRWFLVRAEDVPCGMVLTSARLMAEETRFEIATVTESAIPGVLRLECVAHSDSRR